MITHWIGQHDAMAVQDSLATVIRLMQEHIRADSLASARESTVAREVQRIAGQSPYDSPVLIAVVTTFGSLLTVLLGLVAKVFSGKIHALHAETAAQTGQLQNIEVKVNGQLDRAFAQINDLQVKLAETRAKGTEAAMKELADLHTKLDAALLELSQLRQHSSPNPEAS